MAAMINLPIFLEQGAGLSTAFIGSLIFVRPGFGSLMSLCIGRIMGKPNHCCTNLRIVRVGAAVALVAYICLAFAAELIVAADGQPVIQGALTIGCLFLQASGSFGVFLGGNAIVLERVPEENLSNVSAIRNMMGFC